MSLGISAMEEKQMSKLRGHEIKLSGNEWIYCDTEESTVDTWRDRPCGYCGLHNTKEDHDGCLGTLPGVINACCGHGNCSEAYVQFKDGSIIRKEDAIEWIDAQ